ncbi:MAG TPA: lysyl oxidase family protein, partial [Planctomycetota bacterium]|nr:lysyl oxidase family protein [Planctomycetota bacterium]
YDDTLPNFPPVASFMVCDNEMQGISVGWTDIYSRTVEGQSIDVTDLPDGEYWLENEVDPDDAIAEIDEENNVVRTLVVLGDPPRIVPDRFEPNDSAAAVVERPEAAPRSPNLGPTGPELVLDGLTIHVPGDEDFFRFYLPAAGKPGDLVRLDSSRAGDELELRLLDSANVVLAIRVSVDGEATIALEGLGAGMYSVGARARNESALAAYSLTLRVPRSATPPRVDVIEPGPGKRSYPHALALYTVRWQAHDADGNRTWVRVWLHPSRDSLEGAHLFVGSQWTRGEAGRHTLNTAEVAPGNYWVRCEITDGSTTAEGWSAGTLDLVRIGLDCLVGSDDSRDCDGDRIDDECEIEAEIEADCNRNGRPDACDVRDGVDPDENGDGVPDSCDVPFHRGDLNQDGSLDVSDTIFLLSWLFLGGRTPSCRETGDVDDDGSADIGDAVGLLDFLFRGGPPPADPGPPGLPCGFDRRIPGQPQLGCLSYSACD